MEIFMCSVGYEGDSSAQLLKGCSDKRPNKYTFFKPKYCIRSNCKCCLGYRGKKTEGFSEDGSYG